MKKWECNNSNENENENENNEIKCNDLGLLEKNLWEKSLFVCLIYLFLQGLQKRWEICDQSIRLGRNVSMCQDLKILP